FRTFMIPAVFNWTVNGRSIQLMLPVVAILVVRALSRATIKISRRLVLAWTTVGIVIALLLMRADFAFATAVRDSAARTYEKYGFGKERFWFQGHWGFQYYMQQM